MKPQPKPLPPKQLQKNLKHLQQQVKQDPHNTQRPNELAACLMLYQSAQALYQAS